jgi:hypothetical protein
VTPEGRVKAKVKRALHDLRRLYQFWPVQTGMGASTLDCLLCAGGWFIAIETKRPGGKLTARQEYVKGCIEDAHGIVFVVEDDITLTRAITTIAACCKLADEIRATPSCQ